jgi:hypothetical protein
MRVSPPGFQFLGLICCFFGLVATPQAGYAPASHFFMKLVFAAPDNFLSSLPTAFASQASRLHFWMKLVFAAPTSGLPSFPTALLSQVSCAMAEPIANTDKSTARKKSFMVSFFSKLLHCRRDASASRLLPFPESQPGKRASHC